MANKSSRQSEKRKTGKVTYTFYDKYGKSITFNTATYSEARGLAKSQGLSHVQPSKKRRGNKSRTGIGISAGQSITAR